MNEEQKQKMEREVNEEIRQLKSYFEDDLDEYDLKEIESSLLKMFQIGFYYSQNHSKEKRNEIRN